MYALIRLVKGTDILNTCTKILVKVWKMSEDEVNFIWFWLFPLLDGVLSA